MRPKLQNIVLVCPDNDAESRLILLIAYRLCMCVIRSGQGLGATLERERGDIHALIDMTMKAEVWIVEIPGPEIEKSLQLHGRIVRIIDHHTYGKLDRSRDPDGNLLPSSLEQFLTMTEVTYDQLETWGFDPVVVHGVSIMDARFVQGLREEGYTHEQICRVLDFREACARSGFPDFDKAQAAARGSWQSRHTVGEYTVVRAGVDVPIRGAVSTITIYEDCDTRPFILEEFDAKEIFVQNVDPSVVERLQSAFPEGFTFGTGRCWGVNNKRSGTTYTLDEILGVLS